MIFYKELFHKIEKILWSVFLKPFFFSIDPEKVHHFVVGAMKLFSPIFYLRKSFYHFKVNGKNHPSLEKEVFGTPTFTVNNKIFWGQDRLEYALEEFD